MFGVISSRDILAHPVVTVQCFGWRIFFRALFSGREETFLSLLKGANFFGAVQKAPALLERSIDLELRAKRIYSDFAERFSRRESASRFFEILARQEQEHADLLEVCRAAAGRHAWKINYLNPWQDYLPRLEQDMQEAEAEADSVTTSLEDALRLVLQLEASEINQVFQAMLAASDSLFVRKLMAFRNAMEVHIAYIAVRIPQLAPQLAQAAKDLRDRFP
jgi:rubrerythrin